MLKSPVIRVGKEAEINDVQIGFQKDAMLNLIKEHTGNRDKKNENKC